MITFSNGDKSSLLVNIKWKIIEMKRLASFLIRSK